MALSARARERVGAEVAWPSLPAGGQEGLWVGRCHRSFLATCRAERLTSGSLKEDATLALARPGHRGLLSAQHQACRELPQIAFLPAFWGKLIPPSPITAEVILSQHSLADAENHFPQANDQGERVEANAGSRGPEAEQQPAPCLPLRGPGVGAAGAFQGSALRLEQKGPEWGWEP